MLGPKFLIFYINVKEYKIMVKTEFLFLFVVCIIHIVYSAPDSSGNTVYIAPNSSSDSECSAPDCSGEIR